MWTSWAGGLAQRRPFGLHHRPAVVFEPAAGITHGTLDLGCDLEPFSGDAQRRPLGPEWQLDRHRHPPRVAQVLRGHGGKARAQVEAALTAGIPPLLLELEAEYLAADEAPHE